MLENILKACPFCGGRGLWFEETGEVVTQIRCDDCDFVGPPSPTRDDAIAIWNAVPRQSDLSAMQAEVDRRLAENMRLRIRLHRALRQARARNIRSVRHASRS